MGKIKTVVMGDLEAEESTRKKAEEKREQKKAAKGEKGQEKPIKKTKLVQSAQYKFSPGKKYLALSSLVDKKKLYPLAEAIELIKKTSYSRFDGSVEVHINIDRKNLPAGRQDLRGTITLPHGTGKIVRIKIADDALIANPIIDFDILVATPEMMPKLAKIAKILGPKGLMPNPKTNTIGENPEELVASLEKSASWRTQPDFPIIHAVIGKVSFENSKLEENFAALTKSIGKDKMVSVFLKATMGPSIRVDP